MGPEIVESLSLERSLVDHALGLWSIDHLPEFPDRFPMGNGLAEQGFKATPPPDAFHGKGFEDKG
jgi:hypothetical protein